MKGSNNETTKMTSEAILEIFRSEYESILRRYERDVEKYAIKMNEDYEHFFSLVRRENV